MYNNGRDSTPEGEAFNLLQYQENEPKINRVPIQLNSLKRSFRALKSTTQGSESKHVFRYLRISVCNGFTNQLLALMDGMIMAHVLGVKMILPDLYSNYDLPKPDLLFSELFDQQALIRDMSHFVELVPPTLVHGTNSTLPTEWMDIPLGDIERKMFTPEQLLNMVQERVSDPSILSSDTPIVYTTEGCSIFSMDVKDHPDLWKKRWEIYETIRLRPGLMTYIDKVIQELGTSFVGLHLRLENDWMEHCKTWEGNNCDITSTHTLDGHSYLYRAFEIENIPKDKIIYVASSMDTRQLHLHPLIKEIYNTFNLKTNYELRDMSVEVMFMKPGSESREIHAAIDFFILKHNKCTVLIGNSVSTFSSVQMMYRKFKGEKYLQYNSGNIPLESILGSPEATNKYKQPLKWIFATNSESHHLFYDIKVAVLSAIKHTKLSIYCIYTGPPSGEVVEWLIAHGVHMIYHQISIHDQLISLADKKHAEVYSPLYATSQGVLGTFARLDIPILGFMDEYVLYADTDVVFTRDITLSDFTKGKDRVGELPKYAMCGPETEKDVKDICNAGIMLINIRGMANTYDSYVYFILSNTKGLLFEHGPLDQGAFNDFYAGKATYFSPLFNWKPYWSGWSYNDPYIIHFHGPKWNDYDKYMNYNKIDRKAYGGLLKRCHLPDSSCKEAVELYNQYVLI